MEHLCRDNVLVDQKVADLQLEYLNGLLLKEFGAYLDASPIVSVSLSKTAQMTFKGEAAQGFIDGDRITIDPNLRRDAALMVLAHELGHAWQFSQRPESDVIDDFIAEGFAEWVAFYLVKRAGLTEFSYRIKTNPDPLYGGAFRWYLDLEKEFGRDGVINVMLHWSDAAGRSDETRD